MEKTAADQNLPAAAIEPIRRLYQHWLDQLERHRKEPDEDKRDMLATLETQLLQGMVAAEYMKLSELHNRNKISDEVMRRVEHDIHLWHEPHATVSPLEHFSMKS